MNDFPIFSSTDFLSAIAEVSKAPPIFWGYLYGADCLVKLVEGN